MAMETNGYRKVTDIKDVAYLPAAGLWRWRGESPTSFQTATFVRLEEPFIFIESVGSEDAILLEEIDLYFHVSLSWLGNRQ